MLTSLCMMDSWDKGVCKHSCVSHNFSRVSKSRNAVFLFDFKFELKVSEVLLLISV